MDISYEDIQNILKIIENSSLEELHLEIGDFTLIVRKKGTGACPAGTHVAGARRQNSASPSAGPGWPGDEAASVMVGRVTEAAATRRTALPQVVGEGAVEVKAPMVGTFYRAPAPGAPPFAEVGTPVAEEDTVGIIEVMKLMNSIKAGCRGRVVEICAENGAMVEFGQTLMVIEPLP